MNISTFQIKNYTVHDGLQSNEFNTNAYFKNDNTGELFFGGVNGFNSFFPDSIKDNPFLPKIVLTDLQILNKSVAINKEINGRIISSKPISITKEITLSYWDKVVTFEFAALHYSNPKANKYAYKLEGFDEDWVYTDASKRTASYSNLAPKQYVFMVKASNCDDVWNDIPVKLKINVLPPWWLTWWLTWWAYILYIIFIVVFLFLIYRSIISRIKYKHQVQIERMKSEKAQEINHLRAHFFTSISHEFRPPLTLLVDPLNKILKEEISPSQLKNYGSIMYRNVKRLMKLINQLLDFRKLETGNFKLQSIKADVIRSVKIIADSFHIEASERNIQFTVKASDNSLEVWFDPDKLEKILYNLISNAFKYSPDGGEIVIYIGKKKGFSEYFEISVKDTGSGIPAESLDKIFDMFYQVEENKQSTVEGTGIGLAMTKELVAMHMGEILVESEPNIGSCFRVFLPNRPSLSTSSDSNAEINYVNYLNSETIKPEYPPNGTIQSQEDASSITQ